MNVLVSSKPDKSNQVLSGTATMSWLFEPSGPCSSDLWLRILSRKNVSIKLAKLCGKKWVLLGDTSIC